MVAKIKIIIVAKLLDVFERRPHVVIDFLFYKIPKISRKKENFNDS